MCVENQVTTGKCQSISDKPTTFDPNKMNNVITRFPTMEMTKQRGSTCQFNCCMAYISCFIASDLARTKS